MNVGEIRPVEIQNHDARRVLRRETEYLTEVPVERNENTLLSTAGLIQILIPNPAHALICNRRYVVTSDRQCLAPKLAEILVELEFHSAGVTGTGMMRSRAASAPYAIAALISSAVSCG